MRRISFALGASWAWHLPQNSRLVGLFGNADRGSCLCCGEASWHVSHSSDSWCEMALILAIDAWHAEQVPGTWGGVGAWGLWQGGAGFLGVWGFFIVCGRHPTGGG